MSQDIVADSMNRIMNAIRARESSITLKHHSKLLLSVLAIAKLKGYVKSYKLDKTALHVDLGNITKCQAIKPRFSVSELEIDKYVNRYLPAKNLGIIIVSTSKGLMTHQTAQEKKIGGSLIAYIY